MSHTATATQNPLKPLNFHVFGPPKTQLVLDAAAGAPSIAAKTDHQRSTPKANTVVTSALFPEGRRHTEATLDSEHPLMGPHPTD